MDKRDPAKMPIYERNVSIGDLTQNEKDKLLEAILYHLGRGIERTKWPDEADGHIQLMMLRNDY